VGLCYANNTLRGGGGRKSTATFYTCKEMYWENCSGSKELRQINVP
jgi:hypothetical protein